MFVNGDHAIFSNKHFLVVDDFQGMRTMFREMLKSCGAKQIDVASNGKEAIALLETNRYHVVLCDYNLGTGKNGQQVMEEAKVRNLVSLATAWVVVSAEKTMEMVLGAMEYRPDDYIIKPFTEATVRSRLLGVMARKETLHDIEKAVYANDYGRAIALCDEKIAAGIGHAGDLQRMKSSLLIKAGEREKAKAHVEEVLAQREVPWARVDLARIHYLDGALDQARTLLLQVTEDNHTYMEAYDLLVKILEEQGELEEAQNVLMCSVDLSPNSASRQKTLGDIAQKLGDLDLAEKAFRKTITLSEHSILKAPSAYIGLAKVYTQKNNSAEAMRVLGEVQKTFDSVESTIHAKVIEGMVYKKNRDLKNVQEVTRGLVALVKGAATTLSASVALDAAEFIMNNGDAPAASDLLKAVVLNNHENETVLNQVREVFRKADMCEDGEEMVEASMREVVNYNNTAVHLAKEGKLEEAITLMRDAKKLMPSNKRILLNLSYALIMFMQKNNDKDAGMEREARDCLETVRKLDPGEEQCAKYRSMLDAIPTAQAAA